MRLVTIPGVFQPLSDSWMLAEVVGRRARRGLTVLDPFTGSGVLAITAALRGARATAIDVSHRAVISTRLNSRLNGVRVRALRGEITAPVAGERFDLIVANPPYVPSLSDSTPRGAARAWEAGPDGRRFLDRLCLEAPARLRPGGELIVIHSSICGPGATRSILADAGLETAVIERRAGPLGPLLAARAPELEARGRLTPGGEDLVIVSARSPTLSD